MAARGNSFAERLSRWETLVSNLEPELSDGEMAHLAPDVVALKELLAQGRSLDQRHEALRAEKQETSTIREQIAARGDRLRRRIGAGLNCRFGFGSETLLKFGFRPRRPPVRKAGRETSNVKSASPAA